MRHEEEQLQEAANLLFDLWQHRIATHRHSQLPRSHEILVFRIRNHVQMYSVAQEIQRALCEVHFYED